MFTLTPLTILLVLSSLTCRKLYCLSSDNFWWCDRKYSWLSFMARSACTYSLKGPQKRPHISFRQRNFQKNLHTYYLSSAMGLGWGIMKWNDTFDQNLQCCRRSWTTPGCGKWPFFFVFVHGASRVLVKSVIFLFGNVDQTQNSAYICTYYQWSQLRPWSKWRTCTAFVWMNTMVWAGLGILRQWMTKAILCLLSGLIRLTGFPVFKMNAALVLYKRSPLTLFCRILHVENTPACFRHILKI